MGCGASSNAQISPIDTEKIMEFKRKTFSLPNSSSNKQYSSKLSSNKNYHNNKNVQTCSSSNGFIFSLFLPCRFLSNNSSSLDTNNSPYNQNYSTVEVQTENDLIGFKCQHSQTDSTNMSEEEFELMIQELNEDTDQMNKANENKIFFQKDELEDPDEEIFSSHRTWRDIIKNHKNEIESRQFINVAVQATKKKSTSTTQTKFGSIDYCFVQNKNHQNQLMSLGKNLCEAIVNCTANCDLNDKNLTRLLSSLHAENEDDQPIQAERIVNSLQQTLFKYDQFDNSIDDGKRAMIETKKNEHESLWHSKGKRLIKRQKIHDCIFLLLEDIRNKKTLDQLLPTTGFNNVKKKDVSLQTTNDILTDEAPEYAARSPLCYKNEMIPSILMFRDIDEKMIEAPDFRATQELADYICKHAKNDLFKIRALFTWITRNIKYNFKAIEKDSVSSEILEQREGVSKDYCRLFGDVCRIIGIRVKKIDGFVRDYNYRPGYHFKPGKDALVSWNAVFVLSSWRFIDLTLASGYTDASGEFHTKTNEHYFLTDPNVMIWTHFPYSNLENNYERWQLLDKPITLEEFNALPKVTEYFLQYKLSIRSKIQSPFQFRISTEIKIGSHEAMRYKYKLYPSDEAENSSMNYYVFCQLKEDRLVGSFMVQPPLEGRFFLKIFSKPERELCESQQDLSVSLDPIVTMLLECTKARKYIEPFPLNELPWGLTQKFYDYKLKMSNQKGPVIVTWGGRRRLVLEANETMLITYSLYDSDSMEMDTKNIISREDSGLKTIFTINPPRVGTFKFILFGMPKPKQKGKWRLPLLATLMIDCKLIKPLQHDEDMVAASHITDEKNEKKSKEKK